MAYLGWEQIAGKQRENLTSDLAVKIRRKYGAHTLLPLDNCLSGERILGGDFDIADVPRRDPGAGMQKSPPVTFTWEKRSIKSDSYRIAIIDSGSGDCRSSDDLGYVDSESLTSLPPGIKYDNEYARYVEVYSESDSFDESILLNDLTLKTGSMTNAAESSAGFARGTNLQQDARSDR